jgi:membrane fusion protein (multidrug efflux system)
MTAIKSRYMKSNFYTRLLVAFSLAGLLAACSAASPDDDKKARLEKLKTQQADLSKEITKLEEEIAKANPNDVKKVKAKQVAVSALSPRKFDHYVQTQGSIESENDIVVSAKVPGVITQVFVTEGQQVSKGQVLAQMDNSVILKSIESMESQLELATSVFQRQDNLWKQKIGTEVQYLQSKTAKESLEKQIASLKEQNDMTRLKAPINGTVDGLYVKVGQNTAPGQPGARVVNATDLKVVARMSEAYVTTIKKGNKVIVSFPGRDQDIAATVSFVGRTIDPLSRTFNIEAKLPSNVDLRPNMTATVKVVFTSAPSALVVPVNVIQDINKEKVVYIAVEKDNQTIATRKVVTVEGVYGGLAQVKGLATGDKIITVGYQGLNDGDFIKI